MGFFESLFHDLLYRLFLALPHPGRLKLVAGLGTVETAVDYLDDLDSSRLVDAARVFGHRLYYPERTSCLLSSSCLRRLEPYLSGSRKSGAARATIQSYHERLSSSVSRLDWFRRCYISYFSVDNWEIRRWSMLIVAVPPSNILTWECS